MTGGKSWIEARPRARSARGRPAAAARRRRTRAACSTRSAARATCEKVGTETLRGVETTHYRATDRPAEGARQGARRPAGQGAEGPRPARRPGPGRRVDRRRRPDPQDRDGHRREDRHGRDDDRVLRLRRRRGRRARRRRTTRSTSRTSSAASARCSSSRVPPPDPARTVGLIVGPKCGPVAWRHAHGAGDTVDRVGSAAPLLPGRPRPGGAGSRARRSGSSTRSRRSRPTVTTRWCSRCSATRRTSA